MIGLRHKIMWFLLASIPTLGHAATAVDDVFSIDPSAGKRHLIVTYNDVIDADSSQATQAAQIVSLGALRDANAGSIQIDPDDKLSVLFVPNPQYTGSAQFDYTLQDIRGQSTATVSLTLESGAAVRALPDVYKSSGEAINIFPAANDIIPVAFRAATTITIAPPSVGTITVVSDKRGLFIYTPPEGIKDDVTLNYTLTVEGAGSASSTITIQLDPSRSPLVNAAQNTEQRKLAHVLESACAVNSQAASSQGTSSQGIVANAEFSDTCTKLLNATDSDKQNAMEQILPRQVAEQASSVMTMTSAQSQNVRSRLDAIRKGQRKFDMRGLTLRSDGDYVPLGDGLTELNHVAGGSAGDDNGSRISGFINGSLIRGSKDSQNNLVGYKFDTQSITLGSDYGVNTDLVVGLALGWGSTASKSDNRGSALDAKSLNFSLYGNYYLTKDWFFDWVSAYGNTHYDSNRSIRIGSLNTATDGSTQGSQWSTSATIGTDWAKQGWQTTGYTRLEYLDANIERYRETGGAGLALDIDRQHLCTFNGILGGKINRAISFSGGVFLPEFELEWVHEFKNDPRTIQASLAAFGDSGSFSFKTERLDSSYFNTALTGTFVLKGGRMAYVRYGSQVGRENVSLSSLDLGVRIEF